MGAHLCFFKNYYRYGRCSFTPFFCQLLWLGFGIRVWVGINIKVIAWGFLYLRAGANKLIKNSAGANKQIKNSDFIFARWC